MKLLRHPLVLCTLIMAYTPAWADIRSEALSDSFISFCTQKMPDFATADDMAKALELPVTSDIVPDLPPGRSAHTKRWKATSVTGDYQLVASEFATEAKNLISCGISAHDTLGDEIRKDIVAKLKLDLPVSEQISADGKAKRVIWKLQLQDKNVLVFLDSSYPQGSGVNLTLTRETKGKSELTILTNITGPTECSVKIFQGNVEVAPAVADKVSFFKLAANDFRIEVMPLGCNPSITLADRYQIAYLTQSPAVFSTGAYWVAGDSKTADILTSAATGGNVRTSLDEEIAMSDAAWAKQQYQEACKSSGHCPTPAKTFATAWPFLNPETKENRGFAEFKRFDKFQPLSGATGKVLYAVIYTNWKIISKGSKWNEIRLYLLKPHVIALDFR